MACIADVSGKGVPAALLMSNFQASLRTLIRQTKDLKEIVTELNLTTFVSGNAENFITFFAAIYDFETAELEYINCGHNEIILKEKKTISLLNDGTTVLGMFVPLPFIETQKIKGLRDFFLFTYTDGLTETFNDKDEEFGFDRLMKLIENKFPEDLSDLHTDIVKELDVFKGTRSYHDDITMLSCRIQNK
jgi:sigma-B regulation protein RsbU (phosphoserine phosphatase)